jgi:hypothetical protein
MADYHPLIARAVDGLGTSSGEARRSLYERARSALVAQLRAIEPALSEADITRERLALEDAIRKVEAEAVRKARAEPRPPPSFRSPQPGVRPQAPAGPAPPPRRDPPSLPPREMPAAGRPEPFRPEAQRAAPPPLRHPDPGEATPDTPGAAAPPSARSRLLNARTSPTGHEALRGFRDVVNEVDDLGGASARSAQSARDTRDSYGASSPQQPPHDDEQPTFHSRIEPRFDAGETDFVDDDSPPMRSLEPSYEAEDEQAIAPPVARSQTRRSRPPTEEHYDEPRPPRSYRGLARLAVVLFVIAGLTATISWQWTNITGLYQFFSHMRSRQAQTAPAPVAEPKFSGRVPQDQNAGQAPGAAASGDQAGPAVAQRVVLYEEDPANPQGKRYVGSAVWRTETVSPGPGLAPELAVRADIEVPERQMTVTFSLRRNTDQALPASHTIEIMFNLPPDFAGGGVANVPGVLMKQSEEARGTPLAGLAVKVTNGFFLIGLSAVDADVQRNIQLLKERPWFDIPIVYTNGGRAILAIEKGAPGDRAFADAFAAWGK